VRDSRWLHGLAATLAGLIPVAASARVDVVSAPEVLARHVVRDQAGVRLVFAGRSWDLVTDLADPSLSRLSDGAFHPMDAAEVELAVRQIASVLPDAQILVLPFPRRDVVESCTEGSIVFLSPGIQPVPREHLHATVVHELGHVVENALCPDGSPAWAEYLALRGLDPTRFDKDAAHRDRPREIFAEDFRHLHGGPLATYSGSIENESLPLPEEVAGLAAWFAQLGPATQETPVLAARDAGPVVAPNPFRAAQDGVVTVRMRPPTSEAVPLGDVVDTGGRRVRTLRATVSGTALEFTWDGRDGAGSRVASGVYFVLVRGASSPMSPARVHILR
jgi:hypothetical protein